MRIEAGVRFPFARAPVFNGFPVPFNERRFYGNRGMVAAEPVVFFPLYPLTKGLEGVHVRSRNVRIATISHPLLLDS